MIYHIYDHDYTVGECTPMCDPIVRTAEAFHIDVYIMYLSKYDSVHIYEDSTWCSWCVDKIPQVKKDLAALIVTEL